MIRVFDVVGRPAMVITYRSSSRASASSCRMRGSVGVVADGPDQEAGRAERGDVGRHVGGAAERVSPFAHGDDRNRRLGRQPVGVADEIAVEDDVSNDRHSARPSCAGSDAACDRE